MRRELELIRIGKSLTIQDGENIILIGAEGGDRFEKLLKELKDMCENRCQACGRVHYA